jgi:hypothetical protein
MTFIPATEGILTDTQHIELKAAFRRVLSAPRTNRTVADLSDVPEEIDTLRLTRDPGQRVSVTVSVSHERYDSISLVTDDVRACPHHTTDTALSTLGEVSERCARLEAELLHITTLMCDLPDDDPALLTYVEGDRVCFANRHCLDGVLTFTFTVHVPDPVLSSYEDFEYELGERLGILIDPDTTTLTR